MIDRGRKRRNVSIGLATYRCPPGQHIERVSNEKVAGRYALSERVCIICGAVSWR